MADRARLEMKHLNKCSNDSWLAWTPPSLKSTPLQRAVNTQCSLLSGVPLHQGCSKIRNSLPCQSKCMQCVSFSVYRYFNCVWICICTLHWCKLGDLCYVSPKTSGTLLLSLPSKVNSRHFSSQNISVEPHCPLLPSVCTVCVCVCIFCIIMLEH